MEKTVHTVSLTKGLVNPGEEFSQLKASDDVNGLGWRIVVLSIISAVVQGLITSLTVSQLGFTAKLQAQFQKVGVQVNEDVINTFSLAVGTIFGLFTPIVIMLVAGVIFFIFFTDIGYKRIFAVELYLQVVGVIGAVVTLALLSVFQETGVTLSLAMVTQSFVDDGFWNSVFAGISIFVIWKLFIQMNAYKQLSSRSFSYIFWILIGLNIVFLFI